MFDPQTAELQGTRILVVDDDADNRDMLAVILEHCGAVVATADCAAEALRVLEKERPQILISDLGLPDEDGFDLLRKIRALPQSAGGLIPVIALTGYGSESDVKQTKEHGFQAHLTKPVTPDDMVAAVTKALHDSAVGL